MLSYCSRRSKLSQVMQMRSTSIQAMYRYCEHRFCKVFGGKVFGGGSGDKLQIFGFCKVRCFRMPSKQLPCKRFRGRTRCFSFGSSTLQASWVCVCGLFSDQLLSLLGYLGYPSPMIKPRWVVVTQRISVNSVDQD